MITAKVVTCSVATRVVYVIKTPDRILANSPYAALSMPLRDFYGVPGEFIRLADYPAQNASQCPGRQRWV